MKILLLIMSTYCSTGIHINKMNEQKHQTPSKTPFYRNKKITWGLATGIIGVYGLAKASQIHTSDSTQNIHPTSTANVAESHNITHVSAALQHSSLQTTQIGTRQAELVDIFNASISPASDIIENIYNTSLTLYDCFIIQWHSPEQLQFIPSHFLQTLIKFTHTENIFANTPIIININHKRTTFHPTLLKLSYQILEMYEKPEHTHDHTSSHRTKILLSLNALLHNVYSIDNTMSIQKADDINHITASAFMFEHLIYILSESLPVLHYSRKNKSNSINPNDSFNRSLNHDQHAAHHRTFSTELLNESQRSPYSIPFDLHDDLDTRRGNTPSRYFVHEPASNLSPDTLNAISSDVAKSEVSNTAAISSQISSASHTSAPVSTRSPDIVSEACPLPRSPSPACNIFPLDKHEQKPITLAVHEENGDITHNSEAATTISHDTSEASDAKSTQKKYSHNL